MDGLKRQERKRVEKEVEELELASEEHSEESTTQEEHIPQPKKERKSFLDKLTERVKDFLDNAE